MSRDFRVVSTNVRFSLRPERVRDDVRERIIPHADAVLAQETKNVNLHEIAGPRGFATRQDVRRPARKNSSVSWRCRRARRHNLGGGWRVGVRHRLGRRVARMMDRWIVFQRVEIDGRLRVVLASAHRPPKRYRFLWPAFDRALAAWVRRQPYPVILGVDWNGREGAFARRTGLRFYGRGIVGIFVDRRLRVRGRARLIRTHSDHPAIQIRIIP